MEDEEEKYFEDLRKIDKEDRESLEMGCIGILKDKNTFEMEYKYP